MFHHLHHLVLGISKLVPVFIDVHIVFVSGVCDLIANKGTEAWQTWQIVRTASLKLLLNLTLLRRITASKGFLFNFLIFVRFAAITLLLVSSSFFIFVKSFFVKSLPLSFILRSIFLASNHVLFSSSRPNIFEFSTVIVLTSSWIFVKSILTRYF